MRNKLLVLALAIVSVVSLTIGSQMTAKAAIDNSRDCDKYAIIYCGAYSASEFKDKLNNDGHHKDHTKVYEAMGIDPSDVSGMVDGIVYKNGNVTVKGKTVATDATQAARGLGGTKIPGTSASKVSTNVFGDEGQTAMVKLDKNGKFEFAIIKSCGNPVTAKPKPVTPPKSPMAKCTNLNVDVTDNKKVTLNASASASDGATIKSYHFTITDKSGSETFSKTITTDNKIVSTSTNVTASGNYSAKVVVDTSEGKKDGSNCEDTFKITPPVTPKTPGVQITKHIDGVKEKEVSVNAEFQYELVVTNTGDTDLKNLVVSDTPDNGVTLISGNKGTVSNNKWSYTISSLKKGESQSFTLKAKVTEKQSGVVNNTACVDTKDISGSPDDCDTAKVHTPECVPSEGEDANCNAVPITPPTTTPPETVTETPAPQAELPQTGPIGNVLSVVGIGSLITAAGAYVRSRHNLFSL